MFTSDKIDNYNDFMVAIKKKVIIYPLKPDRSFL